MNAKQQRLLHLFRHFLHILLLQLLLLLLRHVHLTATAEAPALQNVRRAADDLRRVRLPNVADHLAPRRELVAVDLVLQDDAEVLHVQQRHSLRRQHNVHRAQSQVLQEHQLSRRRVFPRLHLPEGLRYAVLVHQQAAVLALVPQVANTPHLLLAYRTHAHAVCDLEGVVATVWRSQIHALCRVPALAQCGYDFPGLQGRHGVMVRSRGSLHIIAEGNHHGKIGRVAVFVRHLHDNIRQCGGVHHRPCSLHGLHGLYGLH